VQFELRDSGDLKRLAKVLRQHANGREVRKELTDGLRGVLRPIVPQIKAAYLSGPSGRGKARRKGGSLRSQLARTVRLEVRTSGKLAGARIRADGRRMPSGMRALPKAYEGVKRFRHPVFGNREVWVAQQSHPTFFPAVQPSEAQARQAIDEVVAGVFRKIERAT
jgi:hypothetical protein